MALTKGTNCGFVLVAPTADPAETATELDGWSHVMKDTSPAGTYAVTEVGVWISDTSSAGNYQIALYSADGGVVPGEAGTREQITVETTSGTGNSWRVISGLNWTLSSATDYWIGVQMDESAGTSNIDVATSGGAGYDNIQGSQTTLNDPYGGGALADADGMCSVYALVEGTPLAGAHVRVIGSYAF